MVFRGFEPLASLTPENNTETEGRLYAMLATLCIASTHLQRSANFCITSGPRIAMLSVEKRQSQNGYSNISATAFLDIERSVYQPATDFRPSDSASSV